ncbi:hypothetical protein J4429_00740 [Candidatus Pacearchaeota archaeon]|nr:hypothetical protein [Candidatus Pacearchaeota archaeon]
MTFKRITKLEINGLIIRDCSQLTSFVDALNRIEAKSYHEKVPDSQEDFENIRRQIVYQHPNRLNVEEFDLRGQGTGKLNYYEEF